MVPSGTMVVDLETAAARLGGAVLAIGTFDGVHLAHRALLAAARARADAGGRPLVALTFDPHPKEFLLPRAPPRLTGPTEKARRLLGAGADAVLPLRFDAAMAAMTQEAFVGEVLADPLRAEACFVGFNFSFGVGGRGRPEDLRRLGEAAGIEVHVLDSLDIDGIPVSSTSIRVLIACGDVAAAARRLGSPHRLTGVVEPGEGRGRGLGFPTANLRPEPANLLLPGAGVYACRAELPGQGWVAAVANVGTRPTFHAAGALGVEVHYLVPPRGELYGQPLALDLVERLRDEQTFPSPEALSRQIREDVARARRFLATHAEGEP